MTPKEEYYKYGESLGISINDLQRLKMLADNCQEDMADNSKVKRFEVIDENGRMYTKHNCTIELSYQDDRRTLKVFITNKQD
jgi:hypothetical protein